MFVLQNPVELVIVTRSEIAHHVLIPEEKHNGDGVVEFVHLLEVWHLIEITNVDDSEVLDPIGDAYEQLASLSKKGKAQTNDRGLRLASCNQDPSHDQSG